MTEQTARTTAPEANRTVVEGELRRALRQAARRRDKHGSHVGAERVLLLRAAPDWRGPAEIRVDAGEGPVPAVVRGCATVLAVLDAINEHRSPDAFLVILTTCDGAELGRSVLTLALGNEVRPVNRWDLVADAFGARRLDPRLDHRDYLWLAEALLETQPAGGWQRLTGPVLQLDTALRRLASVRLGGDERLDAAALLEWSRDDWRVGRFQNLRDEERDGLTTWLEDSVGPVARVVFGLMRNGQPRDAVPFGLAAAELYAPGARRRKVVEQARIRAEERFFGGVAPAEQGLHAFAEAAESLTLRWSENGRADDAREVCDRAERILAELHADDLAGVSKVLDAGLNARLVSLADEILHAFPLPRPADLAQIEGALANLEEHRRLDGRNGEVDAARSAVRLVRWLVADEEGPATLAEGALRQVRSWGWVDQAAMRIWNADTARVPRAGDAYALVHDAVRERRRGLDRAFADRLAAWSSVSSTTDELLLAENILTRIARPVAERRAPLIIVLDGMSTAVACEVAAEITRTRTWLEVGRRPDGREPALATIPSTTNCSRTSLLCGSLTAGGQAEERRGLAAFWRGRRTALFHQAGVGTGAGARLNPEVQAAIDDPGTVVGAVLNTIDDRLRDDRRVSEPGWRLAHIDYLPELLFAAASVGRPVILTSDHGHVLDRGDDIRPAKGASARHRIGEPGDGELRINGPRVLASGGTVVVPWDERVRYLPRRAGYHGGISPAEMVIPVLVFVPSPDLCPRDWVAYENPVLHEPPWWTSGPDTPAPVAERPAARPGRKAMPAPGPALFPVEEPAAEGLGARIVTSEQYASQRRFVRKAPDDTAVATLIDGLAAAGGKLPLTSAARLIGQQPFRMAGILSQVGRLLNVDGYPVLGDGDRGRTVELDVRLLKEQFL